MGQSDFSRSQPFVKPMSVVPFGAERSWAGATLRVSNLLHPLDRPPVQRLLYRDMRHRLGRGGTVPVLVLRRAPQHIADLEFERGPAFDLRPADPLRHNQSLTETVLMPGGAGTGLEMDNRTTQPQAYIADVIAKIAGYWPASRWDELMSWNWRRANEQLKAEAA